MPRRLAVAVVRAHFRDALTHADRNLEEITLIAAAAGGEREAERAVALIKDLSPDGWPQALNT